MSLYKFPPITEERKSKRILCTNDTCIFRERCKRFYCGQISEEREYMNYDGKECFDEID